ncbi:hypothetical protein [Streptomyces vilmorinianum]|uniref:hypothetical protein n=1 Tax=Streptomyces vilmorinianum TaxID=3051092 RepID=UPI0010FB39F0|nr:hypothetical protein [Streptomyces vilmorinianum]
MTVSRLLASLGGLLTAGLGVMAEAPWWVIGALAFGGLLVLRAEALVNARNEARRGLHENRLLGEVSRKQALDYLREIRQAGTTGPSDARQPAPAPPAQPTGGTGEGANGAGVTA